MLFSLLAGLTISRPAFAHCDTIRGPVVTAARAALEAGDPDLVLHWVRPVDDPAVRAAFQHTLAVRALSPDAKELADRYFFEPWSVSIEPVKGSTRQAHAPGLVSRLPWLLAGLLAIAALVEGLFLMRRRAAAPIPVAHARTASIHRCDAANAQSGW